MFIHNKGKYVRNAAGVQLIPGANNVPEKDWKEFSAHPIIKQLVDDGEIVAKDDKLSADEAIELVQDTFDLSILEEMKASESRKTVLKAIDEQIKELKEGEPEQE